MSDSSSAPLPDTPHTGRHLRWDEWERDAECLHERLYPYFGQIPPAKVKRFPSWDEVVQKAGKFSALLEGSGADTEYGAFVGMALYGVFPQRTFDVAEKRLLKRGPLIFKHQELEFGQCWVAPVDKCSKSQFTTNWGHVSAREVMWMSKDPANWYILRLMKASFDFESSACSKKGTMDKRKLEISHTCNIPECLNPYHLNYEQHGGWYPKKPIYPEDVQPGEVAKLPRWVRPGLDYPTKDIIPAAAPASTPARYGGSPFEGRIEVTPNGGQRIYRAIGRKRKRGPDVTVGCGSKSGNVDRTCWGYPVWIDRLGWAATPPCPHTPECVFTLRRARLIIVDNLDLVCMRSIGCVVGEATEEAMEMVRVKTGESSVVRQLNLESE